MSLSAKQRAFIDEYLQDFNGTQAAIRAGYAESGAHVQAYRLLRNVKIAETINERIELYAVGANERLVILSDIARGKDEMTKDKIKAVELLGKLAGDYIDKKQIEHQGITPVTTLDYGINTDDDSE